MGNHVGAVRFQDGSLLYFSHQSTAEVSRRKLFRSEGDVSHDQAYMPASDVAAGGYEDEDVEFMPNYCVGSAQVHYISRASRTAMLITGPRSIEEAFERDRDEGIADAIAMWGRPAGG